MATGWTARAVVKRRSSTTHCSPGQANPEHFQQCAELPLLCNRGLRALGGIAHAAVND